MLAAEEAQPRLTSLADTNWLPAARRRVGRLKRGLRRIAEPLVTPLPNDIWDPERVEVRRRELAACAAALDELDARKLASVMEALHPQLGPTLARWWVDAQRQPYGRGAGRRGFRAPNRPDLTRSSRIAELERFVLSAGPYSQPVEWFATWAPFLDLSDRYAPRAHGIGPLLAAGIDLGGPTGEATFRTLVDSGNGDHPIGGMGRHVIVGLLRSSRPDGWEYIESMLLAAQRQEGLRQAILEAADEAHPDAFTRLIDLAVNENLIRFAATIRAVSVWLGFSEYAEFVDDAEGRLRLLQAFRNDRRLAAQRVVEGDAWDTYAGLCAIGQFDIEPAFDLARTALSLPGRDNRAAAVRFLLNSGLGPETLLPILVEMTADADLAVACRAHAAVRWRSTDAGRHGVYEALDALARRLPDTARTADPVGIDPDPVPLDRGPVVATMIEFVGDRPLEPLLEFLPSMTPSTRATLAVLAGKRERLSADVRAAVLKLVGDRSASVRQSAVEAMNELRLDSDEARELEPLLTRKASDLRRGVIGLLGRLPVDEALASAGRLWDGAEPQRDAACELLTTLDEEPAVVETAHHFLAGSVSATQRDLLLSIVGGESDADDPTLGLFHPDELTSARPPRAGSKRRRFVDDSSFRIAEALDDLAESHRNTPFEFVTWQGSTEVLLADAQWLPSPFQSVHRTPEEDGSRMVLPEIFRTWWDDRPDDCRGESESLDALRALVAALLCAGDQAALSGRAYYGEIRDLLRPLVGTGRLQLRHSAVVRHVLEWVLADVADEAVIVECVDATEAALASVPRGWLKRLTEEPEERRHYTMDWRDGFEGLCPWTMLASRLLVRDPFLMASDQLTRWFGLMGWLDRPIEGAPRHRVDPTLLHAAHAIGAASDADVYEGFIQAGEKARWGRGRELLHEFTRRRRDQVEQRHPTVVPLADRLRERTIEIERVRGELTTPASHLAFRLASIEGAEITFELLARLGRSTLVRGYAWSNDGRDAVFSRLIQISHPAPADTPESVADLVSTHKIKERRLVELAMFAPQWAPTVEAVLGWDGLEDAVWWFHAHTKDDQWFVEPEIRQTWAAMSAERTALAAADLTEGAVDVGWFRRAHDRLGAERWSTLHKTAKLASGGSGHRRAQIFADAMLGNLTEADVVARVTSKRHKDSVRALGLLPLPASGADDAALLRYQALREFERSSKKFGQQRQRSEGVAVRIGIENLARTTGAPDPQRFVWAMEAAESGDLADGPITIEVDDVAVTLAVDAEGQPDLTVRRGDKRLKSVPAKLRKQPDIKALTDRRTALTRQARRVRRSLEDAMVRQDEFTGGDFEALGRHPVVAPMLDLVVWTDDAGRTFRRSGSAWVDTAGSDVRPTGAVRIAHPVDLLGTGDWIDWQQQLFDDGRRQPFKQVFRELYVLTDAEASDSPFSRRWAGHQLQTRQAQGLFTARGWLSDREIGEVAKVHHHAGLVARVTFVDGWGTPAEVELPTIDRIYFTKRNDHLAQPLRSIPEVVFSETMRDLDLVVSVAHAGGVDPEATASTIEMRGALVRETARLMKLDNVYRESSHVLIDGSLGEYSVHLGSATVHRRPGGALCIIPVDAQRRGRLFLPFADEDPKSAEVVSKVLMLARDDTIKDPTILEQLRS